MMRISTAFYFQTGLNSLNRQQGDLVHVFQQLGSGKRMITAADDPLAAAQTLRLGQSESANLRLEENRQVIQRNLGEEENVLMSLITQVNGAKTNLLSAATGTMSDADRTIMAGVFEEMRESMLNLANSKDSNGQYLFSGSHGDTTPFNSTSYEYQGNDKARNIQADQTRQISGSDHGKDIFLRATPGSTIFTTSAGPQAAPSTSDNTGAGVIGGVNITDSSLASNVKDFSITRNGNELLVTTTFTDNRPDETKIVDGIDFTKYDGSKKTLELGNGVSVQLSGMPEVGDTFSLKNAQNHGDELNIFQTLTDVIDVLKTPTSGDPAAQAKLQNVLNGAMQKIDVTYDNILTVRASVGARMNEVEALSDSAALQRLQIKSDISRLEDLDFYSAASQLELRRAGLEAASIAFQKIQATSLFAMNSR